MGVAAKPPIVAERDQTPYLLWREPPELPVPRPVGWLSYAGILGGLGGFGVVVFLAFQQPRAGIAGFLLAGTLAVVTFAAILLTPYIVLRRRAEASLRRDGTRVPARVEGRAATTRPAGSRPPGSLPSGTPGRSSTASACSIGTSSAPAEMTETEARTFVAGDEVAIVYDPANPGVWLGRT